MAWKVHAQTLYDMKSFIYSNLSSFFYEGCLHGTMDKMLDCVEGYIFMVDMFRLCLEKGRIGTWRQMNEDMKQMSKRYQKARTKGTLKTRRQTKQIYIYNKTYIDTLKISLWFY